MIIDKKRMFVRAFIFCMVVSVFALNGYDNKLHAFAYIFLTTTIYISFVYLLDKKRAKNKLKIDTQQTKQAEQDVDLAKNTQTNEENI